jgi:hypothetical protein
MAFGQGPYDSLVSSVDGPEHLHHMLRSGSLTMHFPESADRGAELINLIKMMTAFDSKSRPSIDEVS